MNLDRVFKIFYISLITLTLVLGGITVLLIKNNNELIEYEEIHFNSFALAKELEQSSEDLTKYSRAYVNTGDSKWENKFWEVLDIRNGLKPRADGKSIALVDSIKKLDLSNEEIKKLEEAESNSNNLVQTEKVAFYAMKGIFKDGKKNFTIHREPDVAMARRILYDEKYHKDKEAIINPIKDFRLLLDKRFSENAEDYNQRGNFLLWSLIVVVIITLLIGTLAYFILKEKLIKKNIELEKTNKLLEESEQRYKVIFDESPDAHLIFMDGIFINVNKATERMMHADKSYILGKRPEDISPEYQLDGKTTEESGRQRIEITKKDGPNIFEWIHTRPDGSNFYVEVSIAPILLNGKDAFFTTWRDITKRKKIERHLQESEKRLRIAQSIGQMGSWEMDLATETIFGSDEAAKIYGSNIPDHKISREDVSKITDEQFKPVIDNALRKLIDEGVTYNEEYPIRRMDNGEQRWVHSKGEIDYDINGKPQKIIGILQDITDRKEKENALHELNATKDKFFSIIAHDLKSPFNALLQFSRILLEDYDELAEDEKYSFIQSIDEIGINSYRLLENLLEWSRLQIGKMSFNPEKLNILSVLYPSIKLLEETAKNKNIKFSHDIDKVFEIYADKYMLDTITRNLVSNAIKFTEQNGSIVLKVIKNNNDFEISVKDDGIGIREESLNKLFKIESNVSTRGTANEEGTGLGLMLCKEMVEQHGGKIWVESELGIGTTFTFSMPTEFENLTSNVLHKEDVLLK